MPTVVVGLTGYCPALRDEQSGSHIRARCFGRQHRRTIIVLGGNVNRVEGALLVCTCLGALGIVWRWERQSPVFCETAELHEDHRSGAEIRSARNTRAEILVVAGMTVGGGWLAVNGAERFESLKFGQSVVGLTRRSAPVGDRDHLDSVWSHRRGLCLWLSTSSSSSSSLRDGNNSSAHL